jgi:hypothetical protein
MKGRECSKAFGADVREAAAARQRELPPESVHYRIFFPSSEVLYECISPSSFLHGKLITPERGTSIPISFQRMGESSSSFGDP